MPYSKSKVSELPDYVQRLDANLRAQWIGIWNDSYQRAKAEGKSDADAEALAFRNANGVLKRRGASLSAERETPMSGVAQFLTTLFAGKTQTVNGVAFPAAAFAYVPNPEEPSTWKIRLWETPEAKETPRQVGMAIAALGPGGFRGNKADIPASALGAVKAKVRAAWRKVNRDKKPAEMPDAIKLAAFAGFADEPEEGGDYVLRYGPLFRAGAYPDKGLPAVTAADIAAMAEQFTPCPMDLQHTDTVLDGQVGQVVAVEVAEDDPELLCGTVAVPQWLAPLLPEAPAVSAEVRLADKTLTGLSWVLEGRVPEAVLTEAAAAFAARRHTYSGQLALQRIHDVAAENGAVCKGDGSAKMHARHESEALQSIHDQAVAHGALCATIREANSPDLPFNAREPNLVRANSPAGFAAEPPHMEVVMPDTSQSRFAQFMAWLSGGEAPAPTTEPNAPPAPPPGPGPDPEIARMAAENRRLRQQLLEQEAAKFADEYIAAAKAFPAERAQLIAQYVQAAQDDAQLSAAATFDGQTQSRVGLLRATCEARPAHKLLGDERVAAMAAAQELFRLPSDQTPSEEPSAERLAKLKGYAGLNGSAH